MLFGPDRLNDGSVKVASTMLVGSTPNLPLRSPSSQLLGAATMNNTLCTAIFLALVYFRGLTWSFGAEVTTLLIVQAAMCTLAIFELMPLWRAFVPLLLCRPAPGDATGKKKRA